MTRGDRLGHSWRDRKLTFPGLASDHAAMIRAALTFYEVTGDNHYLERAITWQGTLDRHYWNPETGGYFLTADDAEGLVVRPNSTTDEATPNSNAVAAQNLVRLAALSGQDAWRKHADRLFDGLLPIASGNLFGHVALLNALDLRLRAAEIVVTGQGSEADTLHAAALHCRFSTGSCCVQPAKRRCRNSTRREIRSPPHPARLLLSASAKPVRCPSPGRRRSLKP